MNILLLYGCQTAALGLLALSLNRHQCDILGRTLASNHCLAIRTLGIAGLVLSGIHQIEAPVLWIGVLLPAILTVVTVLTWHTKNTQSKPSERGRSSDTLQ